MKDQIMLVEMDDEAVKLNWTYLGDVEQDGSWQGIAGVWCKEEKFVILLEFGNGYCSFLRYLDRREALKRLYDLEEYSKSLEDVTYSCKLVMINPMEDFLKF